MSRKILIATHGHLASGFKSALAIFVHDLDNVSIIDAYVDDGIQDYTPQIDNFVASVTSEDEGVIFTDLLGGSVNQKVLQRLSHIDTANIHVVSGTNLIAVLATLLEERPITGDVLQELISQAKVEVVSIAAGLGKGVDNEDSFLS